MLKAKTVRRKAKKHLLNIYLPEDYRNGNTEEEIGFLTALKSSRIHKSTYALESLGIMQP